MFDNAIVSHTGNVREVRRRQGRDTQPSAGVIDSQSVRGADTVGADSRGYDAAKRTNGRKRHLVTDTIGLLLVVVVTAASVQERDGGQTILGRLRAAHRRVKLVSADAGYQGGWSSGPDRDRARRPDRA